jgi:glycine betaine/choline ABC-type transport system substrate-binding protein
MRTTTNIRRSRSGLIWGLLVAVLLTACGGPQSGGPAPVEVGATEDRDSVLLANLYAAALRYYGQPADVEVVANPLAELDAGSLRVVPGYTGRLLRRFDPTAPGRSDEQVYKAMVAALPEGVAAGDFTTAAEDKPAVVVTEATAVSWGGRDLTDLVANCERISAGVVRGVATPPDIGTCKMPKPRQYPDAAALFNALKAREINIAWTTTADPNTPGDVVVLADRKPMLIQADNAVPLYRRNELDQQQVLAINQIAGVLDTAALKRMRKDVAEGRDPRTVAEAWLADNPLGR